MARLRSIGSALTRRLGAEDGIALVLALGCLLVFSVAGVAVASYSSAAVRTSNYDRSAQSALALAESGLNDAFSTLYAAADVRNPGAVPERTTQLEGGTVTYAGSYSSSDAVWTLVATGRIRNPTGAADILRTVSSRVRVAASSEGMGTLGVWNYFFSDTSSGCLTLSNNSVVEVPLYVRGNLCLDSNAVITGSPVQVGGTLTLGANATIGSPSVPVAEAHIAGGCTGGGSAHPCTSADRVYAGTRYGHAGAREAGSGSDRLVRAGPARPARRLQLGQLPRRLRQRHSAQPLARPGRAHTCLRL